MLLGVNKLHEKHSATRPGLTIGLDKNTPRELMNKLPMNQLLFLNYNIAERDCGSFWFKTSHLTTPGRAMTP